MRTISILVLALAVAGCGNQPAAVPKAKATQVAVASAPSPAVTCPEPVPPKDEHGKPWTPTLQKPPSIPREFRDIVSASTTVMTVKGLRGQPVCVDLYLIDGISDYEFSDAAHRFFGFEKTDQESNGHYVIDRAMSGNAAIIETGTQPDFSDDDTIFASQQWGDGMDGDFDKLGIWAVGPNGTTALAELDEPTDVDISEWEAVGWSGNRCYGLGGISSAEIYRVSVGKTYEEAQPLIDKLPRHQFHVAPVGKTWKLIPGKCPS